MSDTFFTASPHWTWFIIPYFFVGGLAGGAYFVAATLEWFGRPEDRPVIRTAYSLAFWGAVISGALLTFDLARHLQQAGGRRRRPAGLLRRGVHGRPPDGHEPPDLGRQSVARRTVPRVQRIDRRRRTHPPRAAARGDGGLDCLAGIVRHAGARGRAAHSDPLRRLALADPPGVAELLGPPAARRGRLGGDPLATDPPPAARGRGS